jgi:hypothetical protein
MPKFMTYQRPAPVNKANWGGVKGAPKPGKKASKALADKALALPPLLRGAPKPR